MLEPHRNEVNAVPMQAYMKDQFPFLGIRTPERRRLTRQIFNDIGIPDANDLRAVILRLWDMPQREYQYVSLSILDKFKTRFSVYHIELLEYTISHKSWWDTVDDIASHLVGHYFTLFPEQMTTYLAKWLSANNMWLQRTAILCQLGWKGRTNENILYDTIEKCSRSKEFFIRKAIGWALREYSKTNPSSVRAYVESHPELSGLSRREALKVIERSIDSPGTESSDDDPWGTPHVRQIVPK